MLMLGHNSSAGPGSFLLSKVQEFKKLCFIIGPKTGLIVCFPRFNQYQNLTCLGAENMGQRL